MHETARQTCILTLLRQGPQSDTNMALVLGVPAPSIRRNIQALIKRGHRISHMGPQGYCLVENDSASV